MIQVANSGYGYFLRCKFAGGLLKILMTNSRAHSTEQIKNSTHGFNVGRWDSINGVKNGFEIVS